MDVNMSRVTLNFDLSKIPFVHFYLRSRRTLTPKIKHVHLLVLIWERLQTPTTTATTTTTPTTPDATVQPLGWHFANKHGSYSSQRWISLSSFVSRRQIRESTKLTTSLRPSTSLPRLTSTHGRIGHEATGWNCVRTFQFRWNGVS